MPDLSGSRAVLIGVSKYESLSSVPQAANSLEAMRRMLTSYYCEWPDSSVKVLSNGTSAEQAMVEIAKSANEVEDDGAMLVYFVGHGLQVNDKQELCLALSRTMTAPPALLEQTSLPVRRIKEVINELLKQKPLTTKILILDCCYSGTAVLDSGDRLPRVAAGGMFVLTASRAHQFAAYEQDPNGLTYFTKCLTDIVREGIPKKPRGLNLMDIYDALTPRLNHVLDQAGELLQVPDSMATDQASRFVFAHNVAALPGLLPPLPPVTGSLSPMPKPDGPRRVTTVSRRSLLMATGIAAAASGTGAWLLARSHGPANTPQNTVSPGGATATFTDPPTQPPSTTTRSPDPVTAPTRSGAAVPSISTAKGSAVSITPLGSPLYKQNDVIFGVAFAPHGVNLLASCSQDASVQLWNIADPTRPTAVGQPLNPQQGGLGSLAFHPGGRHLAAGSRDSRYASIALWDITNSANPPPPTLWKAHSDSVFGLAFNSDGSMLASCSADNLVILWDTTDLTAPVRRTTLLGPHNHAMGSVAVSPTGNLIAGGCDDNLIYLWNPDDSQSVNRLRGHTNTVCSVAFTADGRTLVSGSPDGTIRLWDVSDPAKTQTSFKTLTPDNGTVQTVVVSTSGVLAAGFVGNPGTILLWAIGAPSGPARIGQRLGDYQSSVLDVAFSDDGRLLAGGSADKSIRLWHLN